MINTIIKRDGTTQEFSPEKINKWGEWAAKALGRFVDWPSVVLDTVSVLPQQCSSTELQERLIKTCLDFNTWSYNRMAGRLYAALLIKQVYNNQRPTIRDLQLSMVQDGVMEPLNYTTEEYAELEKVIDHSLDFKSAHFELKYSLEKYAIKNRGTGKVYETQQFVYMRMAMALAEDQPQHRKLDDAIQFYKLFSTKVLSAPTPNFVNLGTRMRGYASCCTYTTNDTAPSLAVGDHIAYTMTYMSAGIGSHINSRSLGDYVRNGSIKHQGKLPYYRALVGAVQANLQNGRGGAATMHYNAFDPEIGVITHLKNPRSTEEKKIRGMDYSMGSNKFFAKKVAKGEDVFLFNIHTAPDLYNALYSDDVELFETLYTQYESDPSFKKIYAPARDVLIDVINESFETGRSYLHWLDEMNKHTPFKESIYSSNLCQEIALVTSGYESMMDLYSSEDHGRGEIGLCSLAAINIAHVTTDEQYAQAAYYALLMIDKCIHKSEYKFPHLQLTAQSRLNAGVGMIGLAHYMANNKLKYSSQEGKDAIHTCAETHMYHLIEASLKLSKELGVAKWMHKTKWVDGWMPLDTYNKNVDNVVTAPLFRDWEGLRARVISNGGIRNSVLVAHMPSESSSKANGTTNGLYPIRDLTLKKTDNEVVVYWAAPDSEKLHNAYEIAWDIPTKDMIDVYAIIQKFTDQGISADLYRRMSDNEMITTKEMITDYLYMTKMGLKTRYYQNSKTSDGTELNSDGSVQCGSQGCSL